MAETETQEWNQPSLTGLSKLCHYESRQLCRFNNATLLQHNPNPRDSQGKNRFRLKNKDYFLSFLFAFSTLLYASFSSYRGMLYKCRQNKFHSENFSHLSAGR